MGRFGTTTAAALNGIGLRSAAQAKAFRNNLFEIAWTLFAIPLACESFFGAPLFTRFQVKRVPLDFLYDVFLLDFAFESAQCTLERFALLDMDFRQTRTSPPSGIS